MQTKIIQKYLDTPLGQEANEILRSCVHCGFCTATCPTYQILGDELDSPRGRIYLIKQLLEGHTASKKTQKHLDRCLTCRSCETTCPSGVRYGRLVDIGREIIENQVPRNIVVKFQRYLLRKILPYPKRFSTLLKLSTPVKPFLPAAIKNKIPPRQTLSNWPEKTCQRKMIVLQGCAQSTVTPNTNSATARVLNKLGIDLITATEAGCCGAVSHHLSAQEEGLNFMRRNIDAWWPLIEQGAENIVITASGCGVMAKEYGELLKHDKEYSAKAKRISELCKDICEIINQQKISNDQFKTDNLKIAFQSPCTLQHGQQLDGVVEKILSSAGFELVEIEDKHLCCGSAGTYSILQAKLSQQLLDNKLQSLQQNAPDIIATANIGCQLHLLSKSKTPVKHWIELLDSALIR
jgi:glycolate oxidase iron-sulfur subunit